MGIYFFRTPGHPPEAHVSYTKNLIIKNLRTAFTRHYDSGCFLGERGSRALTRIGQDLLDAGDGGLDGTQDVDHVKESVFTRRRIRRRLNFAQVQAGAISIIAPASNRLSPVIITAI